MRRIAPETAGEEVEVECCEELPIRVKWKERQLQVLDIEAVWYARGRWWLDTRRTGIERHYFRLRVTAFGLDLPFSIEVYRQGSLWKLWRIAD